MFNEFRLLQVLFLSFDEMLKIVSTTLGVNATGFSESDVKNTLFGAALSGADLNSDGIMELLIGAPTHAEDEGLYESGALFILIGGSSVSII